jgi:hypothetical protein
MNQTVIVSIISLIIVLLVIVVIIIKSQSQKQPSVSQPTVAKPTPQPTTPQPTTPQPTTPQPTTPQPTTPQPTTPQPTTPQPTTPQPVDCKMGEWSSFSSCDSSTGKQTRTRQVSTQPLNGGSSCGPTTETQDCPIDCKMGEWSSFSSCDSSTGKQTRTRQVSTQPLNGGATCGPTTETQNCPIDCKMGEWSSFGECNKQTGTKTRTRQVVTQPLNGGSTCGATTETQNCPVDCEVGNWVVSANCDSNGNRTKNRQVIVSSKNGGAVCPVLSESYADGSCFEKEMCGIAVTSLGINSQEDLQTKVYSQDANVQVWEGYNCSITDRPVSGIPKDKLCKYADEWSNSTDRNYYKKIDGSRRAKIILKCPGTLLDEGEFLGAGSTSGNFFTITVGEMMSSPSHGMDLSLDKNIGKKIRIWYGADGYPTGWAFAKDWVYPPQFVRNNITLADLGSIDYTSALEIIDKRIGTSYGYKFLLWFGANTFPAENGSSKK